MKKFLLTVVALVSFSNALANEHEKKWRVGLRFDQLEQQRQSVQLTRKIGEISYVGVLVGSQGFLDKKENEKTKISSIKEYALILQNEFPINEKFMSSINFHLAWRNLPGQEKTQGGRLSFSTEQNVGLKLGSAFLFVGTGLRTNFITSNNPPSIGDVSVPDVTVYPSFGFNVDL